MSARAGRLRRAAEAPVGALGVVVDDGLGEGGAKVRLAEREHSFAPPA
jgi:hypothetical protein